MSPGRLMGRWLLPALLLMGLIALLPLRADALSEKRVDVQGAMQGAMQGAVAADHPLASAAGAQILRSGGNAADAAVAAALVLGVVHPSGSGLGGGGFALVARPGEQTVLDFRETAPAAATADMFLKEGTSSTKGGLAVAVPSEAFGLVELQRRYGRMEWAKVVMPAIQIAEEGAPASRHLQRALLSTPAMSLLFKDWAAGDTRRPNLTNALRSLATSRGELFRKGWVADDIVAAVRAAGGVLSAEDLLNYKVETRTPLRGSYDGLTVLTMPRPSSGGTALLEMLGATEGVSAVHCEIEAAKHAMARRALTGGDVDAGSGPVVDPARIARIRADCGAKTFPADHYGAMIDPPRDGGTTHISVIDSSGLAVALTSTINTSFGSQVVAPKSGILLNNEMDDFTTKPGQPNAFGLVQSAANAVAPGKRPLSSMTPTILLDASGRPVMVAGASGGPFIITSTYQTIRNVLDRHMSPQYAVSMPRWHHQWQPDAVMLEGGHPSQTLLVQAGHTIQPVQGFSAAQAVTFFEGVYMGGADPRKGGEAVVVD